MRSRGLAMFATLTLLASGAAHAGPSGSISNQLMGASTNAPGLTTAYQTLADVMMISLEVDDRWSVTFGGMLTLEGSQPPSGGSPFQTKTSAVPWFTVGADFDPDDHWTFGLTLEASPTLTRHIPTQLLFTATGPRGGVFEVPVDALLRATNGNVSAGLSLGWDSSGDSDAELSFTGSATYTHLSSDQEMEQLERASDKTIISREQFIAFCNASPKNCNKGLRSVLDQQKYSLDSFRLSGSGTLTLAQDTDVTLGADGFLYVQDPTEVGYFRVATSGKTSYSGGAGVPIAPLAILGRAEVTQRFGQFSARLFGTAGRYIQDTAEGTLGVGLKLQSRLGDRFRIWVTGSGQWDGTVDGDTVRSGTVTLGGALRF